MDVLQRYLRTDADSVVEDYVEYITSQCLLEIRTVKSVCKKRIRQVIFSIGGIVLSSD
jgi:hypothetical protein